MLNLIPIADLFTSLKAEHEPWLPQGFVPVSSAEQAFGGQSVILWGRPGSGKSALRMKIAEVCRQDYLPVNWSPEPPRDDAIQGTPLFNFSLDQALRACVEAMALTGGLPARLEGCEPWVRQGLLWFLKKYLPSNPRFYFQSRMTKIGRAQADWFSNLLDQPEEDLLGGNATNDDVLNLLNCILNIAGFRSIYLLVDGLEKWSGYSDERVQQMLEAVLSTLAVFDNASLVFKFFIPESLRPRLQNTPGVTKYRVSQVTILWKSQELQAMLLSRLGLALGRTIERQEFCEGEDLWDWFAKYGGGNPRAWLELARPFARTFLQNPGSPLSREVCSAIKREYPPVLRIVDKSVFVGEMFIPEVTGREFELLSYLEANVHRMCTIEELYYIALEKMPGVPSKGDPKLLIKDSIRGGVDTVLYRLRHKLEPGDQEDHIYLVTTHGKGVRLFPHGQFRSN